MTTTYPDNPLNEIPAPTTTLDRRVVIVDDTPDELAITSMLLRKTGNVSGLVAFTDVVAAIEFFLSLGSRTSELPRLIVLDVNLPGMGGFDFLKWIRKRRLYDPVPVVMWTSSGYPANVQCAARLGAQGYFVKYPPIRTVTEMLAAADAFRGFSKQEEFFQVGGNLLCVHLAQADTPD